MTVSLFPAYGRDYKSVEEIKRDLVAGKDFLLNDMTSRWDRKPCSPLQDFPGVTHFRVRYNVRRKEAEICVTELH